MKNVVITLLIIIVLFFVYTKMKLKDTPVDKLKKKAVKDALNKLAETPEKKSVRAINHTKPYYFPSGVGNPFIKDVRTINNPAAISYLMIPPNAGVKPSKPIFIKDVRVLEHIKPSLPFRPITRDMAMAHNIKKPVKIIDSGLPTGIVNPLKRPPTLEELRAMNAWMKKR